MSVRLCGEDPHERFDRLEKQISDMEKKMKASEKEVVLEKWEVTADGETQPRYWSLREAERAGYKLLSTDPVWLVVETPVPGERYWSLHEYSKACVWKDYYRGDEGRDSTIVVALPGQPNPEPDWRIS